MGCAPVTEFGTKIKVPDQPRSGKMGTDTVTRLSVHDALRYHPYSQHINQINQNSKEELLKKIEKYDIKMSIF